MIESTDQTGKVIRMVKVPERIISLVPSQTELLAHLGLEEEVCGITKFCIHPEHWFRSKVRVGGTKTPNIELIKSLRPDIIFANKEENTKESIEELEKSFPVWTSDISSLDDALIMIREFGKICGVEEKADSLTEEIESAFSNLNDRMRPEIKSPVRIAYAIWKDPYMFAGGDTFINDMLNKSSLENIFADRSRYPEASPEEVAKLKPDAILFSSEPFPFSEKYLSELEKIFPGIPCLFVDGTWYSWYGSRLMDAPEYFYKTWCQVRSTLYF